MREEDGKPIQTHFRQFRDGAILDLIRNPKRGTELILYKDGETQTGAQIKYKGKVWRPSRHPLLASMRLLQTVAQVPADGVEDILESIIDFLLTYIDFSSDTGARVAAHWGLNTWFTGRLVMAPILSIAGPTGSGKTKLARCLSCICRRALMFDDLNPAALRSLPLRFRPTLIMDEIRMNDEMVRLLRAGTHRDGCTLRGGRPIDLFCPKVLITQEPLADAALINRAVEICLVPTSLDMPDLTERGIESIESNLLPLIFRFFLENYSSFSVPDLDTSCLSPHKRDVARACAPGPTVWDQQMIVDLLQPQDENVSAQRFFARESALLYALQNAWLQKFPFVLAGGIASLANEKLESEGERLRLSPREVGPILRSFGFMTERIHNLGIGIWMTQEVMKLINNLGRHYGIFTELSPVNATETQKADAGGKEPKKKPTDMATGSDLSKDRRTRKHKKRA